MESMVKILLQLSVAMTAVSGIVILFLPLLRRYFKPKGVYTSLLILLLGFLIPYRPTLGPPMVRVPIPAPTVIAVNPSFKPELQQMDGVNAALSQGISVTAAQLLFLIWIAGMLTVLTYHITRHIRFVRIIRAIRRSSKQKTMFSTSFYGGKNDMKKRILSIMSMKNKRLGAVIISCVLLLTLSTGTLFAFNTSDVHADAEEKSENYRTVAKMSELERNISVSDYNRKLIEVCEENGKDFFELMSEVSEEIGQDDPLYSFYEDTLSFSSSELLADIIGGKENSFAYCYAVKEEYGSEPVREDYYTDAEWELVQERGPEVVYMVSVSYVLDYSISDINSLTVEERDSLIKNARGEIQAYLAGLNEKELMEQGIKARLTEKVNRTCQKYSGEQMTLNGDIQNIERFGRDGEVFTE